jgi:hypothetical protein
MQLAVELIAYHRNNKPGPMQIDIDSKELEQVNGAVSRWHRWKVPEAFQCNKFFGRISVAVSSPGFNRTAIWFGSALA